MVQSKAVWRQYKENEHKHRYITPGYFENLVLAETKENRIDYFSRFHYVVRSYNKRTENTSLFCDKLANFYSS